MEKLVVPEQNIINAICVHFGRKVNANPEAVEVELMYDDETGFSAEAYVNNQQYNLSTLDTIESLRQTMREFLNLDPISTGIELVLDEKEGIIAVVS